MLAHGTVCKLMELLRTFGNLTLGNFWEPNLGQLLATLRKVEFQLVQGWMDRQTYIRTCLALAFYMWKFH